MNTIHCTLDVLSPVHVGSGVKLKKEYDYYSSGQSTVVVPESVLMDHLRRNPTDAQKFNRPDFKPISLIKSLEGKGSKTYHGISAGSEIHQIIRNGFGAPYIPGSSIKGAIRTILLYDAMKSLSQYDRKEILRNSNGNNQGQWVDQKIVEKVFGKDPNHNLLRVLSCNDAHFEENDVDLVKVKVLKATSDAATDWTWKQIGRDRPSDMEIYAEMIAMGVETDMSLRLDKFLFENKDAKQELNFSSLSFEYLFKTINTFSRNVLTKQIAFFKKIDSGRKGLEKIISECEDILSMIPEAGEQHHTSCILRLSWGVGWQSMTGDWLTDEEKQRFREKYRNMNGTRGMALYPKTRKILMSGGDADTITGWIRLTCK
jgi:CRISPR-associated protein Csm5